PDSPDFKIVEATNSYLAISGIDEPDLVGRNFLDTFLRTGKNKSNTIPRLKKSLKEVVVKKMPQKVFFKNGDPINFQKDSDKDWNGEFTPVFGQSGNVEYIFFLLKERE